MTVKDALRRARKVAARQSEPARMDSGSELGNDGLTDAERFELLVQYRATVGAKPANTVEHQLRQELVREKLGTQPRPTFSGR